MTMKDTTYSRHFGADDARAIRDAVKKDLGPATFKARPLRALWFIPMSAVIIGSIAAILMLSLPWWGNLLLAILAGHTLACQALLAHEVLHGALGMSRRMQDFLGWVGFGPALIAPEFWRRWHNVAHHANTNLGDKDPDSFGTLYRYEKHPQTANFTKLAPGGRTWYSFCSCSIPSCSTASWYCACRPASVRSSRDSTARKRSASPTFAWRHGSHWPSYPAHWRSLPC